MADNIQVDPAYLQELSNQQRQAATNVGRCTGHENGKDIKGTHGRWVSRGTAVILKAVGLRTSAGDALEKMLNATADKLLKAEAEYSKTDDASGRDLGQQM